MTNAWKIPSLLYTSANYRAELPEQFDCPNELFFPMISLVAHKKAFGTHNLLRQWAPQCSFVCVCTSLFWTANSFLWHPFILVLQVNSSSLFPLSIQTRLYILVSYSSLVIHPQAKFTQFSSSTYTRSSTPLHLYSSTRYFLYFHYTLKRSRTADSSKPVSTPMIYIVAW